MQDIKNIDLEEVKRIASEYGTIQAISKQLNIKKSVIRRALYYNYSIASGDLKQEYIKLAEAVREGQYIYNKNKLSI